MFEELADAILIDEGAPEVPRCSRVLDSTSLESLCSLEDLDRLLASRTYPGALAAMTHNGMGVDRVRFTSTFSLAGAKQTCLDPEGALELLNEGATLVLIDVHDSIPSLCSLCKAIGWRLRRPAYANAYITPPYSRGFKRHFDGHDVYVIQLEGQKCWNIATADGPDTEMRVKRGDLLFIPSGVEHEACGTSGFSVHLTIRVPRPTWRQVLLRAVDLAAGEDADLREVITPDVVLGQRAEADSSADVKRWLGKVFTPEILARAGESLQAEAEVELAKDSHGRLLDLVAVADAQTTDPAISQQLHYLARRGLVLVKNADQIELTLGDIRMTFSQLLEDELVFICNARPFTACQVSADLDQAQVVHLLNKLVRIGFLQVVHD